MSAPQPVNPNWQQIQQIQQQNQRFQQALQKGEISQAQYNAAMNEQSRQLTELQKQYSPSPSPSPAPTPQPTPKHGPTPQPKPTPSDAANISNIVGKVPTAITQNPDLNQASLTTNQKDQPLETPRQVGIVFTTGRITQAEIDAYSARGKVLVPDNLKLPRGAKVTGSRIEDGQIIVEYKTTEMQELEQQLNLDAVKWEQAGFTEYAGKAFFPDLPQYGEGAYLGRSEAGEPAIFAPTTQADGAGLNADTARLLNTRAAFAPVQEYYKQVDIKTAEFNALPAETKVSELKRFDMMPADLPKDTVVTDVTYKGGKLDFTLAVDPVAVAQKEADFMKLPPSMRVMQAERFLPDVMANLPAGKKVVDVTIKEGQLLFAFEVSPEAPAVSSRSPKDGWTFAVKGEKPALAFPLPQGEGLGFTVPAGMNLKVDNIIIQPLKDAKYTNNFLGGKGWSTPLNEPVKATQYSFEPIEQAPDTSAKLSVTAQMQNLNQDLNRAIPGVSDRDRGELTRGVFGNLESLLIGTIGISRATDQKLPTKYGSVGAINQAISNLGTVIYPEGLPEAPPTFIGGLSSAALSGNTSELNYMVENPKYAAGSLIGDVLLSITFGKVLAPVTPTFAQIRGGVSYTGSLAKQAATRITVGTVKVAHPESGIYLKSVVLPNMPKDFVQQTLAKNIVNPLKYSTAGNAVVDTATLARNEVLTFNQRFAGVTAPRLAATFAPVTSRITASQPYIFTTSVLAPNIREYGSTLLAPTLKYYMAGLQGSYSQSSLKGYIDLAVTPTRTNIHILTNIAKYDLLNPLTDLAVSLRGEAFTAVQRGGTIIGRQTTAFKYNVLSPAMDNVLGVPRELITVGQRAGGIAARPVDYLKAYSNVNYGAYLKPIVVETKGYTKIAAGKIRYDLDLPVQPSKVPHEYSPWDLTGTFKQYPETPGTITVPTKTGAVILDKPLPDIKTTDPLRFSVGTAGMGGAGVDYAAYNMERSDPDYVPTILSGVAPFPGTRKRQPTVYEEAVYFAPDLTNFNIPLAGAFSFAGFSSAQTPTTSPFVTNINRITQASTNLQKYDTGIKLDARLSNLAGSIPGLAPYEGLREMQAVESAQAQMFTQDTLQRTIQRTPTRTTTTSRPLRLPNFNLEPDKIFKKQTRGSGKRGKYRKGIFEFDILEGKEALQLSSPNGARSNGKRKGRKGLLELF